MAYTVVGPFCVTELLEEVLQALIDTAENAVITAEAICQHCAHRKAWAVRRALGNLAQHDWVEPATMPRPDGQTGRIHGFRLTATGRTEAKQITERAAARRANLTTPKGPA